MTQNHQIALIIIIIIIDILVTALAWAYISEWYISSIIGLVAALFAALGIRAVLKHK